LSWSSLVWDAFQTELKSKVQESTITLYTIISTIQKGGSPQQLQIVIEKFVVKAQIVLAILRI